MILAVDVHYRGSGADVAGLLFRDWSDARALTQHQKHIPEVVAYEPGAFYKRELPCLLALIDALPALPGCVVIDGYVHLGADRRPGLGWHLWEALQHQVAVIGVAKTAFHETSDEARLWRGISATRPLYVSSVGISLAEARAAIAGMHGPYRLPTLLKAVDGLCRGLASLP